MLSLVMFWKFVSPSCRHLLVSILLANRPTHMTGWELNPPFWHKVQVCRDISSVAVLSIDAYRQLEQDGGAGGIGGAERTRLYIKLSFMSLVLLHEDPSPPPQDCLDEDVVTPGTAQQQILLDKANKYFSRVKGVNVAGQSVNICDVRNEYAQACPVDHVRWVAAPLSCSFNATLGIKWPMRLENHYAYWGKRIERWADCLYVNFYPPPRPAPFERKGGIKTLLDPPPPRPVWKTDGGY